MNSRLLVRKPEKVEEPKLAWWDWTLAVILTVCLIVYGMIAGFGVYGLINGHVWFGLCGVLGGLMMVPLIVFGWPRGVKGKVWAAVAVALIIAQEILLPAQIVPQKSDVWPAEGPSEVFGVSIMPEPTPCPPCECRDCESGTWLAQFVHYLDNLAENPMEIRDVLNRAYTETRLTPSAVSETGDWGICQINARAWPDVDTERLLHDPEYAAEQCLRVYRVYFKACGPRWQECYRKGRRGAK